MVGVFFELTGKLNTIIGVIITGGSILALISLVVKYILKTTKEEGLFYGIYLSFIYALEVLVAAGIFWGFPYYLEKSFQQVDELARWVRWAEIFVIGFIFFQKRKQAELRGIKSFLFHFSLLFISWLIDRWVGILAIAVPLLIIYYYISSRIALAIIPFSNPDDKTERRKRIEVFISYLWGLQLPLWKTVSINKKEAEKRIDGAPSFWKNLKGLLWTYPNQIAGISNGPKFRAGGPGLVFLSKGEQPFEIIDLRNRSRNSTIKVISKDGIALEADVTVNFALDSETWTRARYLDLLRFNIMLRDGMSPNENMDGAFPYSQARARSALSYRSKKTSTEGKEQTQRWDDHVLALAEEAAREVLSERSVEDLWKVRENETSSASEEIAEKIKSLVREDLQKIGIAILSAKAANFSSKDETINKAKGDEVEQQNIATWSVEWERHRAMSLANGQAESERIQQEAQTYAHSILLSSIADGLKQTRALHPNLPRYVIAMRFVGALEKILEDQPLEDPKAKDSLQNIKYHFLTDPKKKE